MRCSLFAVSLTWLLSPLSGPAFRTLEGFFNARLCLVISFGFGTCLLGWGGGWRWRPFCLWLTLALLGQAVTLQLIDAGTKLHYQHYLRPDEILNGTNVYLAGFLIVQTVCVVAGLAKRWTSLSSWLRRTFRVLPLAGLLVFYWLSSATLSREISFYVYELLLAAILQTINLGNVVLAVWAFPAESAPGFRRVADGFLTRDFSLRLGKAHLDGFSILAAVWVVSCTALLNILSYQQFPHLADEVVYLLHARYLAKGMLTLPLPPVTEAFDVDLMTYEAGHWFCPVPPGWPAFLAVGVWAGVPWLLNPLLAGGNILLSARLLDGLYGRRITRISLLLLSFSPWYLFLGMSFMPHTAVLTCVLLAAVSLARAKATGKAPWGLLSGTALGCASLIRPLDAVIAGAVLGLWAIAPWRRRLKLPALAGLLLATTAVASLQLYYNHLLTGDAATFPINAYADQYYGENTNAMGFGPDRGLPWPLDPYPGHGLRDVLVNINLNLSSLTTELYGWSIGSLLPAALLLFSGRARAVDWVMLSCFGIVVAALSFYWFSGGPDFAARYWYLGLIPLVALTARGIEALEASLRKHTSTPKALAGPVLATLILVSFTLVNYLPWRATDKYFHYLGMRPDIAVLQERYDFDRSLVLIRGERFPDYMAAVVFNPPEVNSESRTIYAWDRGPEVRERLRAAYPDRRIWVVNGPTITGRGFEVLEGAVAATSSNPR